MLLRLLVLIRVPFFAFKQTVYLAGKAVREIGGKKAEVAVAREITVVPGVSTVSIQSYTGASETTPADNTVRLILSPQ